MMDVKNFQISSHDRYPPCDRCEEISYFSTSVMCTASVQKFEISPQSSPVTNIRYAFYVILGPVRSIGDPNGPFEGPTGPFGILLDHLGTQMDHLRTLLDHLGTLLDHFWGPTSQFGVLLSNLEALLANFGTQPSQFVFSLF